jgi:hypothetical protein
MTTRTAGNRPPADVVHVGPGRTTRDRAGRDRGPGWKPTKSCRAPGRFPGVRRVVVEEHLRLRDRPEQLRQGREDAQALRRHTVTFAPKNQRALDRQNAAVAKARAGLDAAAAELHGIVIAAG